MLIERMDHLSSYLIDASIQYNTLDIQVSPHTLQRRAPFDPKTFLGCALIRALAPILTN